MRRPLVKSSCVVALALLPALVVAQNPPAQQPPAQQPPAQGQPQSPAAPRMALTGQAGVFLYPIKSDQTAAFEELITKVRDSLAKSTNATRKQQLAGMKVYKAAEPMGGNALYVVVLDPAVKDAEYDLFMLLAEGLGAEAGTVANQEMFKRFTAAFASGPNRLNLTPVGGQ
jgi:hypothetical protein